jgi:hypothetical protein
MRKVKLNEIIGEICNCIIAGKMIPIFGAGFSFDSPTKHGGKVPNAEQLHTHIRNVLTCKYAANELCDCSPMQLYDLYDCDELHDDLYHYLETNFIDVELAKNKKDFLNLNFKSCFTLNLDDAIEQTKKFEIILPFSDFYEKYTRSKPCVFKLHGDAHEYVKYKEPKRPLVLRQSEYITSLKQNGKMLGKLKSEMAENNLIFIGCSLDDEIDLLSILEETRIVSDCRQVYYLTRDTIRKTKEDSLGKKGITTICTVENFDDFYNAVIEKCALNATQIKDPLALFCEVNTYNLPVNKCNTKLLLNSDALVSIPFNGSITYPEFIIERDILAEFLQETKTSSVNVVYGHRISGKTYFLVSLYKRVSGYKRYFFPSGTKITNEQLNMLTAGENQFIIFDTNCLDIVQLGSLIKESKNIKIRNNVFVITFNSNEKYNLRLEFETKYCNQFQIDCYFSRKEEQTINRKLECCRIPTLLFKHKYICEDGDIGKTRYNTLIDNLAKIAREFEPAIFQKDYDININDISSPDVFAALLLLARNSETSIEEIYRYGLVDPCEKLLRLYPKIFSKIYVPVLFRGDSALRIFTHSRFILLKKLGEFADNEKLFHIVGEGYKEMFKRIEWANSGTEQSLRTRTINLEMLEFIKFDLINDLFFGDKNNRDIIYYIYNVMEKELGALHNYKHQRAKSIISKSWDDIEKIETAKKLIDVAVHDATNDFARNNSWKLEISLEHMHFTKTLIYGRLCELKKFADKDLVLETLKVYDKAFAFTHNQADIVGNVDLKTKGSKRAMDVLLAFVSHLNCGHVELGAEYKALTNKLRSIAGL